MITIKPFQSCSYDEKMMILSWRNDPEIRSYMINNRVIPIEEHLSFVEKLNSTDEMEYYLVRNDERYIGVISLTNIKDGIAELGVYKNPMETEKGTGVLLLSMIHKVAVRRRIQKISLKVYKTNKKALHLYERCEIGRAHV